MIRNSFASTLTFTTKLNTWGLSLFVVSILCVSGALASPVYQENFNFDSLRPQDTTDAKLQTGWSAYRSGSRVGVVSTLKISDGIDRGAAVFNSFPTGGSDGNTFWVKEVEGLTIFTEEYPLNVAHIEKVSYLQRLDGITSPGLLNGTRLALRIKPVSGSERWYLSDPINHQTKVSSWETVTLLPKSLSYFVSQVKTRGTGPAINLSSPKATLPIAGVVTAFGVFLDTVTDRVRIDNFLIEDSTVSNGIPPQTVPPRPEGEPFDAGNGDPTPPPTAVPGPYFQFCAPSAAFSKRAVSDDTVSSKIIAAIKGNTIKALQDRAILTLLVKGIRADSVINVRVSDFYKLGKKNYLNVYGKDSKPVKLSVVQNAALNKYISKARLTSPTSPLFGVLESNQVTTTTRCQASLDALLKTAIRKSGQKKSVRFRN